MESKNEGKSRTTVLVWVHTLRVHVALITTFQGEVAGSGRVGSATLFVSMAAVGQWLTIIFVLTSAMHTSCRARYRCSSGTLSDTKLLFVNRQLRRVYSVCDGQGEWSDTPRVLTSFLQFENKGHKVCRSSCAE